MRSQLIRWLKVLLRLLEVADARLPQVKELIAQAEAFGPEVAGYRKRAWVLSNLITAFPEAKVKDLSFLIEQVIQER